MYEWAHCGEDCQQDNCVAPFGQDMIDTGVTRGFAEGSQVTTDQGPCAVEDLRPGDRVMTLDEGMQTIRSIQRQPLWSGFGDCPQELWPLHIPAGLIGNQNDMLILSDQAVRLPAEMNDPDTLVPALTLRSLPGVRRVPSIGVIEVIRPILDADQLVVTDDGALLYCPADWSPLYNVLHEGQVKYQITGSRMATELADVVMSGSPFTARPVTFPADLLPNMPGNQANYPVQIKIA